jgi:hypothetical protein
MQNRKTCTALARLTLGQLRVIAEFELRPNVPHWANDALERLCGVPITAWSAVRVLPSPPRIPTLEDVSWRSANCRLADLLAWASSLLASM